MPDFTDDTSETLASQSLTPSEGFFLRPGVLIDGIYKIENEIGSGGAGSVFKVEQVALRKCFAMKIMNNTYSDIAMRRFEKEARIAANLEHPNLVRAVHSGALPDGKPFYVMDLVKGDSLATRLRKGPLSETEMFDIFIPLCFALDYAHEQGLVHRDLKPGNTVLVEENGTLVPKIIDFGIAHLALTESTKNDALTRTGEVFGTPKYMSPEQCLSKKIDRRSDIYSLGCMMFECLTGEVPLVGENAVATIMLHVNASPPTLKEASLGNSFARGWQELIEKMLAKEPARRFQTCREVANALIRIQKKEPLNTEQPKVLLKTKNSSMAIRPAIICGALIALLLIVGSLATVITWTRKPKVHQTSSKTFDTKYPLKDDEFEKTVQKIADTSSSDAAAKEAARQDLKNGKELNYCAQRFPQAERMFKEALELAKAGQWEKAQGKAASSVSEIEHSPAVRVNSLDYPGISVRYSLIALCAFHRAIATDSLKMLEGALGHINEAIKQNSAVSSYYILREQIHEVLNQPTEAKKDAQEAARLRKLHPLSQSDNVLSFAFSNKTGQLTPEPKLAFNQEYASAKELLMHRQWLAAQNKFATLLRKEIEDTQEKGAEFKSMNWGLYYNLIAYCMYRQSFQSTKPQGQLLIASKHVNEGLRLYPRFLQAYRLKMMIDKARHMNKDQANDLREYERATNMFLESQASMELKQIMDATK